MKGMSCVLSDIRLCDDSETQQLYQSKILHQGQKLYTVHSRGELITKNTEMSSNSTLNIIESDQFEDVVFDKEDALLIQANFYKGAPPQWVNFHLSEKDNLPFVKRHGYEDVRALIEKSNTNRRIVSMVNLFHKPGSGGSTLAMQVLWDLRKEFRCAKLKDAMTERNAIVKDVMKLTEQKTGQKRRKPVLLLLDNVDVHRDNLAKHLKRRLIDELNYNRCTVPVIILNCVRKTTLAEENRGNTVTLHANLQVHNGMEERKNFQEHQRDITNHYKELQPETLHGLNIITGDFDQEYIADTCKAIVPPKIKHRPRIDQLFAILTLISKFAPGSYLLLDQCIEFLRLSPSDRALPFDQQMGKFSKFVVRYRCFEKGVEYVCIAHPHIATKCVAIFTDYEVRMSAVTSLFLEYFCTEAESHHLMQMAKTMLTMRETDAKSEEKNKFPKLIQHIIDKEGHHMSTALLSMACGVFRERPIFPQALARCYYLTVNKREPIKDGDYKKAEYFAREAIRRHPDNSFIMNTLGQVHKHHLIHFVRGQTYTHSDVLRLGRLALDAFQEEEKAAEMEETDEKVRDETANIAPTFNSWGKLAYLQVALQIFESLVKINSDWRDILTCSKEISKSLDLQLNRKNRRLIRNLQGDVQKRFDFFEKYLTYSQGDPGREDPAYIRECANRCFRNYVGATPKALNMTFEDAGKAGTADPEEDGITTMADLQEFLERHSSKQSPEFYHLGLLQTIGDPELCDIVLKMEKAYENMYEKYFRTRHLVPLYMKSTSGWQTLSELSLKPWEVEKGAQNEPNAVEEGAMPDQRDVCERLGKLERIQGAVERPKVFAFLNNNKIAVQLYNKEMFCKDGPISFYLGFTIRGPVAFNARKISALMRQTSIASEASYGSS
ncbi:sterile alpha motif domain-containing protein 9-like isoform X1 [Engraulis encrasicolus]|uniref:sterile alpha motif domain-containing protein 9-like isoform X1 n=2 Tax=Engraulis encrasicolus TaxID=184585 RepID=UPI002FD33055